MPIYEYICAGCKKKFEVLRPMSEADATVVCSDCHVAAKRILSTFAAVSKDAGGQSTPLSSSCSGCNTSGCATCGG